MPRLLDIMESADDFIFDTLSQIRMDTWSRGRVVLLGDAACCAAPSSGMGTSQAMAGAYVLAGELAAAAGDHGPAFAAFEKEMRDYAAENQLIGRRAAEAFFAPGGEGAGDPEFTAPAEPPVETIELKGHQL
ncbi:FAD-dependent monooxygenase [Streptomyces sp. NPDC050610]|uniref:FAD-dependent monooxygenase n=1 Tax=Streptomyces sp. NPDC050610 TaxID=3157097 RepID=UPI0034296191